MRIGPRPLIRAAAVIVLAGSIGAGQHALALQGPQAAAPPASTKPMTVDEVFKNVQALKGISVDDFLLTMGIMSAAVGSDCVGCHPSAGTDHVDWALDTPRKRTARRMVEMVTAINRDHFAGRQVVTCWTCHRGRDRPVITPTLDTVYGEPALEFDDVLTPATGVPSVDQVLNKYLHTCRRWAGARRWRASPALSPPGRAWAIEGSGAAVSWKSPPRLRTSAPHTSTSPNIQIAVSA
ncbi:MAG: photosynthetic reaction center cytochrome c subunit [Acidobacteria bacterium]|nr:photosynthetic reaction center cytochrome c subunit [Acidobacteriota bacterium]